MVLEHLALREILTSEHITGGPPCPGLESFKDSILILTEHADKQVHQIARNFRDRWIPRYLRRYCCMERDDGRSEFHQCSSHDGLSPSNAQRSERGGKPCEAINSSEKHIVVPSSTVGSSTPDPSSASAASSGTKTRKRKSRWDNPVEERPHSRTSANLASDGQLSVNENIPPEFSSLFNGGVIPSDAAAAAAAASTNNQEIEMHVKQHLCDVILGDSQQRFIARVPISYGVPKSVMQKFGVPRKERSDCWTIAPGVPFHPFPPLPPHASGLVKSAARCALISEVTEKEERHSATCTAYQSGKKRTRTCSMDPTDDDLSAANGHPDFKQGTSYSLGRKFFRQRKCNPVKLAPPWVRI